MSDSPTGGPGFEGHLPQFHVLRLHERGALPTDPTQTPFSAAVLFVDIVGFTSLTDHLSSSGRRGTEAVSEILNRELDPVVREILRWGGDVIVFAGDAVLAIWPFSDDEGRGSAASRSRRGLSVRTYREEPVLLKIRDRRREGA